MCAGCCHTYTGPASITSIPESGCHHCTSTPVNSRALCRLMSESLRITQAQGTQFYPQAQAWLEASGSETLGTKGLLRMLAALGPAGLAAQSELLGVRIRHLLQGCLAALRQGEELRGLAERIDSMLAARLLCCGGTQCGAGPPDAGLLALQPSYTNSWVPCMSMLPGRLTHL